MDKSLKDLTVLILAGGDSTRFWPLGDKNIFPFCGKNLVYYKLFQLAKIGFSKVVVVTNQDNDCQLKKLVKDFPNLDLSFCKQTDPHGMAGAIISSKKEITGEKILIVSPEDLHEDFLFYQLTKFLKDDPEALIAGLTMEKYFPGGYLKIEGDKILDIIEKPKPNAVPSKIINFVFHYFKDSFQLLDAIEKVTTSQDDVYEKAIQLLIKKGMVVNYLPYKGFWGYLKYPWHVLNISSYFLSQIKKQVIKKAIIDKSVVISGPVYIDDNVRILENVKITGPCYLGFGTIVGNNVLIRESMIGDNCVIGYNSEIVRSYIGANSWFHTNYIGDSVISDNVGMGAGSILANFKLGETSIKSKIQKTLVDTGNTKLGAMIGRNSRIGVNSSIMPGVKIGQNCFIGPSVVLENDLPDGKYCKFKQRNYEIVNNKMTISEKLREKMRKKLKIMAEFPK